MEIPEIVKEEAKRNGNTIRYLGEYDGEQVFSVCYLDKHGEPLPTGMPALVFFNGTKARTEISEANFDVIEHVSAS